MNIKNKILVFIFSLSFLTGNCQNFKIKYDKNFKTNEIVAQDTIKGLRIDSLINEQIYPINCNVHFDEWIILHTCKLFNQDSIYKLCFYKYSFGLQIVVAIDLDFKNESCNGIIRYNKAVDPKERIFKIDGCNLLLNTDRIKKHENIQGQVDIKFTGDFYDELSGETVKRKSKIFGDFHVIAK